MTSTRGCDDDSCPDCPTTQRCTGGETLTLVGRDFCPQAVVELSLTQYSSVVRCDGYRPIARNDFRQATCNVPMMPNSAWQTPAQVYVSLRCPGEDPTPLYPALTYQDEYVACTGCGMDDSVRRSNWMGAALCLAVVLALCAVHAVIRRRRMALRQAAAAAGGVLTSVAVPMYVPLVERPSATASSASQPQQQHQQQQVYSGLGTPYSVQSYAYPQLNLYGQQPVVQH